MLVTFRTEAYGNITMFGGVAIRLLKLMGHSGTVPSAIAADDVPRALRRLQEAVEELTADEPDPDEESKDSDDESESAHVRLRQRAFPLIELLLAAARENVAVSWDD